MGTRVNKTRMLLNVITTRSYVDYKIVTMNYILKTKFSKMAMLLTSHTQHMTSTSYIYIVCFFFSLIDSDTYTSRIAEKSMNFPIK